MNKEEYRRVMADLHSMRELWPNQYDEEQAQFAHKAFVRGFAMNTTEKLMHQGEEISDRLAEEKNEEYLSDAKMGMI